MIANSTSPEHNHTNGHADPGKLPPVRKVVTYHNDQGQAVVQIDETLDVQPLPLAPGLAEIPFWVTHDFPSTDCNSTEDGGQRKIEDAENFQLVHPRGSNLRFTDLAPGACSPFHRTSSIDYNILIHGELTLIMEDLSETHLRNPGDTVVQKGTMHAWKNPGTTTTRWASVLLPAQPAVVGGKELRPEIGGLPQ